MTITEAAPPVTDPDAVDHAAALKKAGGTYARKQRAADTAREALVVVIRNAFAGGLGKKAIAETAGVARETVYKALRGTPGADEPDDTTAAIAAASQAAGPGQPTIEHTPALETGERATA